MAECQSDPLKPKKLREVDEEQFSDNSPAGNQPHDDGNENGHGISNQKSTGNGENGQSTAGHEGNKRAKTDSNKNGKDGGNQGNQTNRGGNGQPSTGPGNPDQTTGQEQARRDTAVTGHEAAGGVSNQTLLTNNTGQGSVSSSKTDPRNTQRSYSEVTRQATHSSQPPPQPSKKQIDFYLLIIGHHSVDQAYISLGPGDLQPLQKVLGQQNLWRFTIPFADDPMKGRFKYKYGIHKKGHDYKIPFIGARIGIFSTDPSYCEERAERRVKSEVEFDVFHYPDDRNYQYISLPQSVIFYIQLLLPSVLPPTISEILPQVESLNYKSLTIKHMEEIIRWMVEQISAKLVTDAQCLYLCVVLGHIQSNSVLKLSFPSGYKTGKTCDRLLECLSVFASSNILSKSDLKALKAVATLLVENSSSPGWLTLAAYFYSYFGVKFLLEKENTTGLNYRYDVKEYQRTVNELFLSVKDMKNQDDKVAHQHLLLVVLKSAPVLNTALDLFQRSDVGKLFGGSEHEMVTFFVKFYQDRQRGTNTHMKIGAKLEEFFQIPKMFREKVQKLLYPILLDYAKSEDELKAEHVKIFLNSIIQEDVLALEQVQALLIELSKSKSVPRQDLVLKVLNNDLFQLNWYETQYEKKLHICRSWVFTRVSNMFSRRVSGLDKTKTVYQAIDSIMRCTLNITNANLAQDVSTHIVEKTLATEDALSVLHAFASIEQCTAIVQDCYKSYVRKILTPKVVKKSSKLLEECSTSSLGRELLSCILEMVDVSESVKDNDISEDDFKKIIDLCDIWIILLKTKGKVASFKKYRVGKTICQRLQKCIEEGDVSLSFLEEIEKEGAKVSRLCAVVLEESIPLSSSPDLQKQVLNRISKLVCIVKECLEKIQLLGSAIKFGKKLSNDVYPVHGMEGIIETFNNLKKTWRSRPVCELQGDTFWGEVLLPLLSPAEALQPLVNSLSFRALAKKGLKELSNSTACDSETKASEVIEENSFYSLMAFLTTKTIEHLQAQWNPVLHDPGSLSVETMKTLLGTLKDQKRLEEELILIAKYFRRSFSPMVKTYIQDYVKYPGVLTQVQHVIGILKIFGLTDPSNKTLSVLVQFQTIVENSDNLTLAQLHKSMLDVKQIVSSLSGEDLDCVIEELSRSSELLGFIEEIVDEDIRFLIDAVEEHSDQFVSESSVSDLIDVHGFLAPLIKKKNKKKCDPQDFLKALKESCLGHQGIAVKIQQCSTNVNSLRGLYTSIANRGEITKEIIGNCLSRGEYCVSQKDGTKMSYLVQGSDGNKRRNYSLPDLHDLRSRAHLIVSSHKNASKNLSSHDGKSNEDINFDDFINQVNLLTEISTLLSKLRSSGHAKYRQFWKKMKTTDELQTNRDDLLHDLESWENLLEEAREKFYFLNYYRSDQLCMLYDFFTNASGSDSAEVLPLIHFVDQEITKQHIEKHRSSQNEESYSNDSPKLMLTIVGETLENIFSESQPTIRLIPDSNQNQLYSKLKATVTPGEIFVASLEPESPLTANVMLTLYENTSQAFPEPHQIVFCTPDTTWEELHLLLQRCFCHSDNLHHKSLFCIANVELLPNELQFKLVIAIKDRQKCYQSCETVKENADYQLALICRGGDHHHIVEQFSQYSHHIAGMTDLALAHRLKCNWPHVKMVTSSLPGLGKTEQIKRDVLKKQMNVATFSISGPFEPEKLVQRLGELKLKKYHCLHLDIGEVSDPLSLDTFLFQLIVTGMVSAGNQFYHLPLNISTLK